MGGFSGVVGTEAPLEWGEGRMGEDGGLQVLVIFEENLL